MIKLLRSITILFCFGVFGTGALILNIVVFPIAKLIFKENDYMYFSSDTIYKLWGFFVKLCKFTKLIRLEIKDLEKIKNIKNKVIVATHPSFIDIVILLSIIPRSTCLVKSTLSKNLLLNNIVNSIFILEDETIDNLKSHTKKMIDNGFNVIIFPSGIRHRKNETPKIRKGAATIAINSQVDIVALKYYTDYDFLFINQPIYEAGEKPVTYELSFAGEINVLKELEQTDNEIVIKKNITKKITSALYD